MYLDDIFEYPELHAILREHEQEINAAFLGNGPSPRQVFQAYDGLPRQFVFDEEAEWSN